MSQITQKVRDGGPYYWIIKYLSASKLAHLGILMPQGQGHTWGQRAVL